ncbi:universal stress protein [Streptomyces sp. NPDC006997]|uniref:universal stress protein n=1 Tax=Streptomyces sp. NPDC006997 TaxID=3155356 RepID=UPI0033C10F93
MTAPVIVGLDGSPASVTAAWWAARAALDRHAPLLLLHSWTTQPLDVPIPQEARSKQCYGEQVLHRMSAELRHRHRGLTVATELVSAPAAEALLAHGEGGDLLVLGSRGHGSVASFLLGSISLRVLSLARCPAVTVRAGDSAVETGWGHPPAADHDDIVAGVQHPGPDADPLLELAFAEAGSQGGRVRAVRALPPSWRPGAGPWAAEGERLAAALEPWRRKYPDVPAVEQTAVGPAASVLLSASAHARLVVVGRRRRPHQPWRLGPVAHAALRHAPCPVAVVPHD